MAGQQPHVGFARCTAARIRDATCGRGHGSGGEGNCEPGDGVDERPHVLGGPSGGLFTEVVPAPLLIEETSAELVECRRQRAATGPLLQDPARQFGKVVPIPVSVVGESEV
jgi:hypothetical protein